jgi:curli biogenesis system outer membrane secretion channel CsgG
MKTDFVSVKTAIVAVAVCLVSNSWAENKYVPTISVAKTEASGVAAWQPAMGEGLAQMMITELSGLPNFKVLESVALDDLRAERALGDSGEVAASESVKKGQWKGADYTFKSTVTRFGSKENTYGGGGPGIPHVPFLGGGFGVRKTENEVQIDWRIIDNATREIVPGAAGRAVGVESGTSFNFSTWSGGGFNNNREFMDSALGKATMKAIADISVHLRALNVGPGARTLNNQAAAVAANSALRNIKGSVKMVDGKEVWVSLGSANGFAPGDKVKIYKTVEKKNKKGELIATVYEPVAEIVLKKVQKDKSMGEYTGDTPSAKIGPPRIPHWILIISLDPGRDLIGANSARKTRG